MRVRDADNVTKGDERTYRKADPKRRRNYRRIYVECLTKIIIRLAPPLGMNSLALAACPATMCPPSASFLKRVSLAVTGLRALLCRFLEGALYKYLEWMNRLRFRFLRLYLCTHLDGRTHIHTHTHTHVQIDSYRSTYILSQAHTSMSFIGIPVL